MEISLQHNINELTKNIEDQYKRQIPFAFHLALNRSSFKVFENMRITIPQIFNKPINATIKSTYFQITPTKASQGQLKDMATKLYIVGEQDQGRRGSPASYLLPQIIGGARQPKISEIKLRQAGLINSNEFIIPALHYTDSSGNVKAGITQKILNRISEFNLNKSKTRKKNPDKVSKFFILKKQHGKLIPAIYERKANGRIIPVFIIINKNNYKPIYNFQNIIQNKFNEVWSNEFKNALDFAIKTAK